MPLRLPKCDLLLLSSGPHNNAGVVEAQATISGVPKYRRPNDVEDMLAAQMAPIELQYGWHELVLNHATNNLGVDPRFFKAFADHPDMGLDEQTALAEAYTTDMWTIEALRRMLASITTDFVEQSGLTAKTGDRLPTVFKIVKKQPTMIEAIKTLDGSPMSATEAKTYDKLTSSWGPRLDMLMTALNFRSSERYHDVDAIRVSVQARISDMEHPAVTSVDTAAAAEANDSELERLRSILQLLDGVILSMRVSDAIVEQVRIGPFKTIQSFAQPSEDQRQQAAVHIEQTLGAVDPKIAMKRSAVDAFIEGIGGVSSSSSSTAGGGSSPTAKRHRGADSNGKAKSASGKFFKDKRRKANQGTTGAQRRLDAKAKTKARFTGTKPDVGSKTPPSSSRPPQKSKTGQGTNMPSSNAKARKGTTRPNTKGSGSSGKGRHPASKGGD